MNQIYLNAINKIKIRVEEVSNCDGMVVKLDFYTKKVLGIDSWLQVIIKCMIYDEMMLFSCTIEQRLFIVTE